MKRLPATVLPAGERRDLWVTAAGRLTLALNEPQGVVATIAIPGASTLSAASSR